MKQLCVLFEFCGMKIHATYPVTIRPKLGALMADELWETLCAADMVQVTINESGQEWVKFLRTGIPATGSRTCPIGPNPTVYTSSLTLLGADWGYPDWYAVLLELAKVDTLVANIILYRTLASLGVRTGETTGKTIAEFTWWGDSVVITPLAVPKAEWEPYLSNIKTVFRCREVTITETTNRTVLPTFRQKLVRMVGGYLRRIFV